MTRYLTVQNTQYALLCVLLLLLAAFLLVMCWPWAECYIGRSLLGLSEKNKTLTFLGIGMGGMLLALQALMSYKRAKALENTAAAQVEVANGQARATKEQARANQNTEQGQRQQRLRNAIQHLGHKTVSVRLGGAYELFHLVEEKDMENLRQTVLDILCAHIRQKTGTAKYREVHKARPSEEIQSLLFLLFMRPHDVFKGCSIDLRESWLNGADLSSARLSGAILTEARLQGAYLKDARLDGAFLKLARLQSADLRDARLLGAVLHWAGLQGADLSRASLHGASLGGAGLQETNLTGTRLHGVKSWTNLRTFAERIQEAVDQEGTLFGAERNLAGAKFSGGLTVAGGGHTADSVPQNLDSIVDGLDGESADNLRACLQQNLGLELSRELPERSGAVTGTYTRDDADKWIAEYEGAP